jgi:sulfatase modifying factor 1
MQKPTRSRATSSLLAVGVVAAVVALGARPARSQVQCPGGMAYINGFCIDRFEASLVEILPSGEERPHSPYLNPGSTPVRAVSARGVVPQGYISQVQATQACARAGKRLCGEAEWFRACRGPRQRNFGYGNTRDQGRCNENHRWHPVVRLFSATARYLWGMSQMNDPQINQLPGTLALTGAHNGCTSEHGVFDMVGNLHEWTNDPEGTFRGGYYMDTTLNGDGCWYRTAGHNTVYHDYSIGFRCCATAGE